MSQENIIVNCHQINYVDLYETRAVRNSSGASYGKKGFRVYQGTSKSHQEWTHLARGTLTLESDRVIFTGGGQSRVIQRNKIISIVNFVDSAEIEISVSNRQKSMRFALPGRTVDDSSRLAQAINDGDISVPITQLTKDPGGCYIATYTYGNYNAPEVLILRKFRDEKLLNNFIGKLFVKIYYAISPFLVRNFHSEFFKKNSKKILDKFVNILK